MNIKKIFDFGKIDYFNCGKKTNKIIIEVELKNYLKKPVLSIYGSIWENKKLIAYGQILEELSPFLKNNALFIEIYTWWKKYHLNNLHVGTELQEIALQEKFGKIPDYITACKYLKKIGLYNDNENIYGAKWYYRKIPENDLKEIVKLIESGS